MAYPISNYLRMFQSEGMTSRVADTMIKFYAIDIWNIKGNVENILVSKRADTLNINHLKSREHLMHSFVNRRVHFVRTKEVYMDKYFHCIFPIPGDDSTLEYEKTKKTLHRNLYEVHIRTAYLLFLNNLDESRLEEARNFHAMIKKSFFANLNHFPLVSSDRKWKQAKAS